MRVARVTLTPTPPPLPYPTLPYPTLTVMFVFHCEERHERPLVLLPRRSSSRSNEAGALFFQSGYRRMPKRRAV